MIVENITLNLSTDTFITNECYEWCVSNIPKTCSKMLPHNYIGLVIALGSFVFMEKRPILSGVMFIGGLVMLVI